MGWLLNETYQHVDEEEEEEEIDDDEEEELDDVEPSDGAPLNGDSALSTNASAISAAPLGSLHSAVLSKQHSPVPKPLPVQPAPKPDPVATKVKVKEIRRSIGTLKFVRTVDGKGYMRKQSDNLLQKAKATVAGKSVLRNKNKKKKKRFFKGANYRFDGKPSKKKVLKASSSRAPSEAGSSDAQLTLKDVQSGVMELEEADVLSYLGIQRKGSEDGEFEIAEEIKVRSPTSNKAKKSFRPSLSPTAAAISER